MYDCKYVTREMLSNPIHVSMKSECMDFQTAKAVADHKAREVNPDAMLLSWFDRRSGRFSPDVICCGTEKPTWLTYAESRCDTIPVDINNEEFVFVYSGSNCRF